MSCDVCAASNAIRNKPTDKNLNCEQTLKSKKPNNPIEVSVVIKPESAPEDPTPIPIIGYFVNNIRYFKE